MLLIKWAWYQPLMGLHHWLSHKACPYCRSKIDIRATVCPYCQKEQPEKRKSEKIKRIKVPKEKPAFTFGRFIRLVFLAIIILFSLLASLFMLISIYD